MSAIKLRDVPDRFFDTSAWRELMALARMKQNAIELLDAADPEESSDWWDVALPEISRQDRGMMFSRARSIRSNFHRDLIAGKYDAFGFFNEEAERVCIPQERFPDLYPRFATGRLQGRDLEFTAVLIIEAEKRETPAAQFQRQLTDWIRARRAEGVTARKAVKSLAKAYFRSQFNERSFDIAYKSVFDFSRGRPPKHLSGRVYKSSI